MKVRLICGFNGETVAEASRIQDVDISLNFAVFANRVFEFAFDQGDFRYFREVRSIRIQHMETLRNETSLPVREEKDGN